LMGGTTSSLRVAVGVSAIWWAVFTIPAWRGLPGGGKSVDQHRSSGVSSLAHGWKRVATMIKPSEIKSLPNLFTFLLAWIFLSDGMSPYNLDTTALTTRFPHYHIYRYPLRLFHPPNGSTENHLNRCPGPTSSRHLLRSCSSYPKATRGIKSEITTLYSGAGGDHTGLCLYWAYTSLWRLKNRRRDVHCRYLVWAGKLNSPALDTYVDADSIFSYMDHSIATRERCTLSSYHRYVQLCVARGPS
jgi:hypothetical protein